MIARLGLSLSLLLCGCWSSKTPSTDSRTNWLTACESNADCGGGAACVCGICTASCAKSSDCNDGSDPAASCADPVRQGVEKACERRVRELGGRVCVPDCAAARDCASGWSCSERSCLPTATGAPAEPPPRAPKTDAAVVPLDAGPTDVGPSEVGMDAGSTPAPSDEGKTAERLLRATVWEAPGARCATGGVRALSGIDGNGNGALDDAEVGADALTCNDARSSDGSCTELGAGTAPALVACTSGAFVDHCAGDGLRVDDGHDTSFDGVLDEDEVESSAYACAATSACDGSTWQALSPGLACCDLAGVELDGVQWGGVDLSEADLQDATLTAAELQQPCSNCPAARLNCANLRGVQLNSAKLSGALFGGANLIGAQLNGALAEGARFENVNLTDADLADAQLSHAQLSYADLVGANLRGADLQSADLRYANLSGADLTSAKLARAATAFVRACPASLPDAGWACVSGARPVCGQEDAAPMLALIGAEADLAGANLTGRALAGMNLSGANLSGADLSGAQLSQTDLRGTNLRGAQLNDADLGDADLRGARLDSADVTGAITARALTDGSTVCPGGTPGPCW